MRMRIFVNAYIWSWATIHLIWIQEKEMEIISANLPEIFVSVVVLCFPAGVIDVHGVQVMRDYKACPVTRIHTTR